MHIDTERKMTETLYLEDLQPGQKFTSHAEEITEAEIKEFAQKFDPQPFHLDHEAAKSTLFGGLAASGWHTAAITMRHFACGV
jgi:acyl dehydratase